MLLQSGHLKYCNALQSSAVWEEFITLFNTELCVGIGHIIVT